MATRDNPVHPTGQPRFECDALAPQDLAIILNNLHLQADDQQATVCIAEARDTLNQLHGGTRALEAGQVTEAMDSVQRAQAAAIRESVRVDLRGVSDALASILNERVTRGEG